MPNIAALLKEEITRLARKETRQQLETLKRASAQYRSDIASLKREVAKLTQQGLRLKKTVARASDAPADGSPPQALRFVAKGLRAHRSRLGLSATKYAALAGVSPQAIFTGSRAHPVREQVNSSRSRTCDVWENAKRPNVLVP